MWGSPLGAGRVRNDRGDRVPGRFVADHIEVIWDLDSELAEQAAELGVALARATTPNSQPRFARLALDLADEMREGREPARVPGGQPVPVQDPVSAAGTAPRVRGHRGRGG